MTAKHAGEGRIEYLSEGFVVHWDEAGLEIEVIDYQTKPLRLYWKDLLSLQKAARGSRRTGGSRRRERAAQDGA